MSLNNLLQDINFSELSLLHESWPSLNWNEKFFSLVGSIHIEPSEIAAKKIRKYEKELKEKNVFDALLARALCDYDPIYVVSLKNSLLKGVQNENFPLVEAQLCSSSAYLYLGLDNFLLAKELYGHSAQLFKEQNISSLAWRSLNNQLICDIHINKDGDFSNQLESNLILFETLPQRARLFLLKILAFQLCYLGKPDLAVKYLEDAIQWAQINKVQDPNLDRLNLHAFYIQKTILKKKISENQFNLSDGIKKELELISDLHKNSDQLIFDWLSKVDKGYSYNIKFMLIDLLFHELFTQAKYGRLIKIFKELENRFLPHWGIVISPRSIYESACLASLELGLGKQAELYKDKIERQSRLWEIQSVRKKISKIENGRKKKLIQINYAQKEIEFGQKTLSLAKSTKAFDLVNLFYEFTSHNQYRVPLSVLSKRLGGRKDHRPLLTMINRLENKLEIKSLFQIDNNDLIISRNHQWKRSGKRNPQIKNRKNKILSLIKKQKAGISAKNLLEQIECSKKTMINDLNELIREGLISKIGSGPSTRYKLKN